MHVLLKFLIHLCHALGLPDWAAFLVVIPVLIFIGIGAVLIRRKYFQILKRKIAPYGGTLRHGIIFWAPTAFFEVDGVPGRLPWVSFLGMTRLEFAPLPAAGRLVIDNLPLSAAERRDFHGEAPSIEDKVFSGRFQMIAAPGSFGSSFLDSETRKRILALHSMSREILGRGEDVTPPGRFRLEIDGRSMRLTLKGQLGTPEVEKLLRESAALVRRVVFLSHPPGSPLRPTETATPAD